MSAAPPSDYVVAVDLGGTLTKVAHAQAVERLLLERCFASVAHLHRHAITLVVVAALLDFVANDGAAHCATHALFLHVLQLGRQCAHRHRAVVAAD